ncbi:MAG TPA: hypothetical protein PLI88_00385 [Bacillota bacterium]|nr:hypothetical protein [Bacillota bacterium]HOH09701.1 hypothetical protein [Bacillota bacterium]HOY89167.1 hypothetical protein [Bacillota bacterium]HPI00588.1 hypothetical protein [Bacillota bacterium]HPM63010.1 hypothetical protein [Bacillota bacterium]
MDEKIVPRWEWRTFGPDFPEDEKNIKKFGEPAPKRSEEVYVLSRMSDENTKIREGLMDIKMLQETNANRLEQWKPVMKEAFPLDLEKLKKIFAVYKVALPHLERDEYTKEQFLDELVRPNRDLKVVEVRKERYAYTINGTIVEFAKTWFNGIPSKTFCVEHEDPELVMKTVKELGLGGYPNINYIKAMKKTVGF